MMGLIGIGILLALNLGNTYTLAPIIVIFVLIVAAAGLTRGGDFFSFLGIGALLGITTGMGKGGSGKGLRSATSVGRRGFKKYTKDKVPKSLAKKAAAKGKARRVRALEKKQVGLIAKAGAAARGGSQTAAQRYLSKAAAIETKKAALGGKGAGLVNQAVKIHRGILTRPSTQQNIAAGFALLQQQGGTIAAQSRANIDTALGAASAAGGSRIAGWSAGSNLKRAVAQHNNLQTLLKGGGGFATSLATPPKSIAQKLSGWGSTTFVKPFQKGNILATLTPWVPGLGIALVSYAAYTATKGTLPQLTGATPLQAGQAPTAVQAARSAKSRAQAAQNDVQTAQVQAQVQYSFAQTAVNNGATLLSNVQLANSITVNNFNAVQTASAQTQNVLLQAQMMAAQAGRNSTAAIQAANQAKGATAATSLQQKQATAAQEAATDAAEATGKTRGFVRDAETANTAAQEASKRAQTARLDAQAASARAEDAQKTLNTQASLLNISANAVASARQAEADAQNGLAQALTVVASTSNKGIKDQATKQAENAQNLVDQTKAQREATEKTMASYQQSVQAATKDLTEAQAAARDASDRIQTAKTDAQSAADAAATTLFAAYAAAQDAAKKADTAYTSASQVLQAQGIAPAAAAPQQPTQPTPPPTPAGIPLPSPPAPLPPPDWIAPPSTPPPISTALAPPPEATGALASDYKELAGRSADIQDMLQRADVQRAKAANPLTTPEFRESLNRQAEVLEAQAFTQQAALLDEMIAYRFKAAQTAALEAAKGEGSFLSPYRAFPVPPEYESAAGQVFERGAHEEDARTEIRKGQMGYAWSKEANAFFENERTKKVQAQVQQQMTLEQGTEP